MATTAKLAYTDALVQLTDGGAYSPTTAPSFGSAVPITMFAKTCKISDKVETLNAPAWGDTRDKKRPTRGSTQITLELYVVSTGLFATAVGNILKVERKVNSAQSSYDAFTEIVVDNDWDNTLDQMQYQTLTIECDVDQTTV